VTTGCTVGSPRPDGTSLLDCSGFQVDRAPRWTLSGGYTHTFTLDSGATLAFNPTIQWVDSRWGSAEFTPIERLPGYTIGNVDLTFTSVDERWTLGAYVRNVGNTMAQISAAVSPFTPNYLGVLVLPPRTYGARLTYKFGS